MRAAFIAFTLATIAIVPQAFAQGPAANPPPKLMGTAAEIQAMIDANKAGGIVNIGPYRANLELRAAGAVGNAAIHPHGNEFFYIIDGTVDINTGGTLLDQKSNPNNTSTITGSKIDGGTTVRLSKGDFYIVPVNTPHQLTPVGGKVADMSIMLPAGPP